MQDLKEGFVKPFIRTLKNNVVEIYADSIRDGHFTESEDIKNSEENRIINDDLIMNMSHEFKTPLNVILGASLLMELNLNNDFLEKKDENFIKNIDAIKHNCYRLTKLVNNMLDSNKIESKSFKLKLSNNDIVKSIRDIVQVSSDFVKEKSLNIVFSSNIKEKIIAFDSEQIDRVLLNLISNAIKFSETGGNIFVNLLDKGDFIEIEVKDDGIGIDKSYAENIFNKYSQVDKSLSRIAEGSGIGLFLVKSIIELHGGNVSVSSNVDQGSSFKINILAKTLVVKNNTNKVINYCSKKEMMNIEFSDINI